MADGSAPRIIVLGVGNLLLSDEGVGIQVVQRLQQLVDLPEEVQVVDGGTLGLDLLYYLESGCHLLIIDAVETEGEPGTVVRLEDDQVPSFLSLKISPHQVGITDMLFAARLRDLYPARLVLWGVQPGSLELGLTLSPPVAAQVDFLVAAVLDELARWGVPARPRAPAVEGPTPAAKQPAG